VCSFCTYYLILTMHLPMLEAVNSTSDIIKPHLTAGHGPAHLRSQLLGRLRQEDHKFKASLEHIVRSCLFSFFFSFCGTRV
jgi:hypothetical protein